MDIKSRAWASSKRLLAFSKSSPRLGWIDLAARRLAPFVVRPPKVETQFNTPDGLFLTVPAGFASAFSYRAGAYEPEVRRALQRILDNTSGAFIDVGANIGYFSLLAHRWSGGQRRIWSFEADPKVWKYLVLNLQANGATSVDPINAAITDGDGNSHLVEDRHGSEGHLTDVATAKTVTVPTRSLDSFLSEHQCQSIAAIKLDIEGHEIRALEGLTQTVTRSPTMKIIVEVNPPALTRAGGSAEGVVHALRELGFDRLTVIESGQVLNQGFRFNAWQTIDILASRSTHG